jgi:predicted Zn-ribbon and HTH transcriptional regulator
MTEEKVKIEVIQCTCARCGHVWIAKQPHPTCCAKCKSAYWNKPRKEGEK